MPKLNSFSPIKYIFSTGYKNALKSPPRIHVSNDEVLKICLLYLKSLQTKKLKTFYKTLYLLWSILQCFFRCNLRPNWQLCGYETSSFCWDFLSNRPLFPHSFPCFCLHLIVNRNTTKDSLTHPTDSSFLKNGTLFDSCFLTWS